MRRPRGMTLIELLVTSFCLVLLSGVLFTMLVMGKSLWQASAGRTGPVQDLRTAARRLEIDLSRTDPSSITVTANGLSMLSAENSSGVFVTDASGDPTWQKQVVWYVSSGLRRKEVYGSTSGALSVASLQSAMDGSGTKVGPSVTGLTAAVSDRSTSVQMTAQGQNENGEEDSLTLDTTVYARN